MNRKKAITVLALASVLLFVLRAPADAAQVVKQTAELTWGLMNGAVQSMQTFLTALTKP